MVIPTGADGGSTENSDENESIRTVEIHGGQPTAQQASDWSLEFTGGVVSTEGTAPSERPDEFEASGQVSTGTDTYRGTGAAVIGNYGVAAPKEPITLTIRVDGQPVANVAPGTAKRVNPDGSVETVSTSLPTDGRPGSASPLLESGFLSLIPGLLPGVGPLNSSQTTAAAIIVALALAGTVLR